MDTIGEGQEENSDLVSDASNESMTDFFGNFWDQIMLEYGLHDWTLGANSDVQASWLVEEESSEEAGITGSDTGDNNLLRSSEDGQTDSENQNTEDSFSSTSQFRQMLIDMDNDDMAAESEKENPTLGSSSNKRKFDAKEDEANRDPKHARESHEIIDVDSLFDPIILE